MDVDEELLENDLITGITIESTFLRIVAIALTFVLAAIAIKLGLKKLCLRFRYF